MITLLKSRMNKTIFSILNFVSFRSTAFALTVFPGHSLRCYQRFKHDDDSGEDMHDSNTQRGIYQSDRVHARKFLERQLP